MKNKKEIRAYINFQMIKSKAQDIISEADRNSHIRMLAQEIYDLCKIAI